MECVKSVRRVAVVAHFDAEGRLTDFTRSLLGGLLEHVERIVLVSTRLAPDQAIGLDRRITVIVRENVGYDFYSFRTGILAVEALYSYDELIIANDSVLMIDPQGITRAFEKMDHVECDAWGMTESYEVSRHLQSYFLVFRKNTFFSQYFHQFWRDVRVLDDKWEIILSYEVGLTQWLLHHGARIAAAFQPDSASMGRLIHRLERTQERLGISTAGGRLGRREALRANPVHYLWDDLYRQFGFIKAEVLRDDPNGVRDVSLADLITDPVLLDRVENEVAWLRRARVKATPLITADHEAPAEDDLLRYSVSAIPSEKLKARFAIVLHLYHMDLIDSIHGYMCNMLVDYDLFVSVKCTKDRRVALRFFEERNIQAFVYVHPNIGRDVGPFISLFNTGLLDRYDAVCKIHSKKSVYHDAGGQWRDELLRSLLGSSHTVLRILQAFKHEPACGIVGPERAYLSNAWFWGGNEERLRCLAAETGIEDARVRLGFFAGTMFWFRPAALRALRERAIALTEFAPEAGQLDATLAHVIERLFVLWVEQAGFFAGTTRVPDAPLCHEAYENQGLAVLRD